MFTVWYWGKRLRGLRLFVNHLYRVDDVKESTRLGVFAVGKNHNFENLRDWFQAIYEVLLGASQGPRFGGFISLYGVDETIELINQGLNGELIN